MQAEEYFHEIVSIHAPGRGATGLWIVDFEIGMVSIHAPGRGATEGLGQLRHPIPRFNSRTREGCDP